VKAFLERCTCIDLQDTMMHLLPRDERNGRKVCFFVQCFYPAVHVSDHAVCGVHASHVCIVFVDYGWALREYSIIRIRIWIHIECLFRFSEKVPRFCVNPNPDSIIEYARRRECTSSEVTT